MENQAILGAISSWWLRAIIILGLFILVRNIIVHFTSAKVVGRVQLLSFLSAFLPVYLFHPYPAFWSLLYSLPCPFFFMVIYPLRTMMVLDVQDPVKETNIVLKEVYSNQRPWHQLMTFLYFTGSPFVFELFHSIHSNRTNYGIIYWILLIINVLFVLSVISYSLMWGSYQYHQETRETDEQEINTQEEPPSEIETTKYQKEAHIHRIETMLAKLEKYVIKPTDAAEAPVKFQDFIKLSKELIGELIESHKYTAAFNRLENRKAAIWRRLSSTLPVPELEVFAKKDHERITDASKQLRLIWTQIIDNLSATRTTKIDDKSKEYQKELFNRTKRLRFANKKLFQLLNAKALEFVDLNTLLCESNRYYSFEHWEMEDLFQLMIQQRNIFFPPTGKNSNLIMDYFLAFGKTGIYPFKFPGLYNYLMVLESIAQDFTQFKEKLSAYLADVIRDPIVFPNIKKKARQIMIDMNETPPEISRPRISTVLLTMPALIQIILSIVVYNHLFTRIPFLQPTIIGWAIIVVSTLLTLFLRFSKAHGWLKSKIPIGITSLPLIPYFVLSGLVTYIFHKIVHIISRKPEPTREEDFLIRSLKNSVKKASRFAGARIRLSEKLFEADRYREAIDHLICAAVAVPANMNVYYLLGATYTQTGKHRLAIDYLSHYLRHSQTKRWEAYFYKGNCRFYMGEYHDALDDYFQAEKLSESAQISFNIGTTYEEIGNQSKAFEYFKLAAEKDNNNKKYREKLSFYLQNVVDKE